MVYLKDGIYQSFFCPTCHPDIKEDYIPPEYFTDEPCKHVQYEEKETIECDFTYFKPSGKYYTEGKGLCHRYAWRNSRPYLLEINGGCMPGLSGDGSSFIVLVNPPEGVPVLLSAGEIDAEV